MTFPISPPVSPMLARVQSSIPTGEGWLYEPKWDGFRAIVFRDKANMHIGSRNGQPLERYFPELVEILLENLPPKCVLDGEIVIATEEGLDFNALLQRIHPADSRVRMLAEQTPSSFIAFDMLAVAKDMRKLPLSKRRNSLEQELSTNDRCLITPQTADATTAEEWFEEFEGAGLDGIVAKKGDMEYVQGERVMVKIKHERTADCVVGGFRLSKSGDGIGSLLLGLYDDQGVLHHTGFTSSFKAAERRELLSKLEKHKSRDASFEGGRVPGGPSRWNAGKDVSWISLEPVLVCEVAFDHLQGDRFRHGTRFLRWRPDKAPSECTYDQLIVPAPFSISKIRSLSSAGRS